MKKSKNINVLHHVFNYFGYSGATEQAIKVSRQLDRKRFNPIFVNSQSSERNKITDESFDVLELSDNPFSKIFELVIILFKYPRRNTIHHVHGFHFIEISLLVLFRRSFIFKCTLSGVDDLESIRKKPLGVIKIWLVKQSAKINSLNPIIDSVNENYVDEKQRVIIPNGVDIPISLPEYKSAEVISCDYVIFVGAIVPRKGVIKTIEYYIETFNSDVKLILLGPFGEQLKEFDTEYFGRVQNLISQHPNRCIELVGKVESGLLIDYYANANAMLFFSEREGTPNVVLEAMSHNCPVLFSENDKIVNWLVGPEYIDFVNERLGDDLTLKDKLEMIRNSSILSNRAMSFDITHIAKATETMYISQM